MTNDIIRIIMKKIIIFILITSWDCYAAVTLPTLPQATVDTVYSLPTGTTYNCTNSAEFSTALTNAALNDVIVLTAGTTYTGPFTLPNKASGSGWIYIKSSAYSSLPQPGTRIGISDASNMPKITPAGSGSEKAIITSAGAHHFRFVGIEVLPRSGEFNTTLIYMGGSETSESNLPNYIIFDRCYIHGDATVGSRRGIALDAKNSAVINSYLSNFKEDGSDSQAIWVNNTNGPLKIENNYLEAAGECMMFGGDGIPISGAIPSDITISKNTFSKDLSWVGSSWDVKNLLESKNSRRVLVEGNEFKNTWNQEQQGYSILVKPVNQDSSSAWVRAEDWTIKNNRFIDYVGAGIQVIGVSDQPGDYPGNRFLIENNLLKVESKNGSVGYGMYLGGAKNMTINHNTIMSVWGILTEGVSDSGINFTNNIYNGDYGFKGTGYGDGTATLNYFYSEYSFTNNAAIGRLEANYPSGNCFPADIAAVKFTDYNGGNYRLASDSDYKAGATCDGTDNQDLGTDITALEAAMANTSSYVGSVSITGGSHTITLSGGTRTITLP